MEDTQSEIRTHLAKIQSTLGVCESALLDEPLAPEMAVELLQRLDGARDRMKIVWNWLDHRR